MHSVFIVIHLFVAIGLVSVILLQRSEGGALGIGGGPGGLMSGRAAGNALTRATTILAVVFFLTSIMLTVFTDAGSAGGSVIDRVDPSRVNREAAPPTPEEDLSDFLAPSDEAPAVPEEPAEPSEQPPAPSDAPAVPD